MGPLTFVIWLFLAILVGIFAGRRGRSGIVWWLIATFLSPLLAWLLLLALGRPDTSNKDAATSDDTRKCPYCAELVKVEAVKCKHCGSDIGPASAPGSTQKVGGTSTGEFMG